ncbi:hypothetical protein [Endozoicomonas sp. ALE010]|uniref:hypothetical protein n=1 Tax=Endozoicomonas sp. ALE010 TaxID=3403081 RepID=UPI003BB64C2F
MDNTGKKSDSASCKTKVALTLLTLLVIFTGFLKLPDDQAHDMLNDSMVAAGASFAVARSLDATISVAQSTGVSVGIASIDLGQVLNPLSDLIDKFSWVMTVAVGSLTLQKILLVISSSKPVNILLAIAGVLFLAVLWTEKFSSLQSVAVNAVKAAFLLRFAVVVTVGLSLSADNFFLDEQIKESSSQVETVSQVVTGLSKSNAMSEQETVDGGFLSTLKNKFDNLSSPAEKATQIKESVEDSILGFMNLITLFLLKTILLPLGFLLFTKRLLMKVGSAG